MNRKYFAFITIVILIPIIMIILEFNKSSDIISNTEKSFTSLSKQIDIMCLNMHNDTLYAGTPDGLFKVSGTYPEYYLEKVDLANKITFIRSIYTDTENDLWIGGLEGLICIRPENEILYTKESGLIPGNNVNTITQTSDGSLWIGTWSGAACLKKDGTSTIYTENEGLIKNMVNIIVEDETGGIWFASYNVREGGISYLKNGVFTYFTQENGLIDINTTSMLFIDNNTLWFGSGMYEVGGITVFDISQNTPQIKNTYVMEDGFAGEKVRSLYKINNTIIIGSEYDGIALWNDTQNTKKYYTVNDGLPHNEVKCYAKKDGLLFLGTRAGLCFLNPDADFGIYSIITKKI